MPKISPNRLLAFAFGVAYAVTGLLGFIATADETLLDTSGSTIFGVLQVNPLQNLTHLLVAAVLLAAALRSVRISRVTNAVVGVACLALGFAGLFMIGEPTNILAVNAGANLLHFATAAMLLMVGLGAEQVRRPGGS